MGQSGPPTANALARASLESLQRSVNRSYGLPTEVFQLKEQSEVDSHYLSLDAEVRAEHGRHDPEPQKLPAEPGKRAASLMSTIDCGGGEILHERVGMLLAPRSLRADQGPLDRTCFGTIPGGGLDAHSYRVPDTNQYCVVIPSGLFQLANMLCKIITLLRDFENLPPGGRGSASDYVAAQEAPMRMMQNPYIRFRMKDLLRAMFRYGDAACALPYGRAVPYQDYTAHWLVGIELFVVNHEVAHLELGHNEEDATLTAAEELAADELAISMLSSQFEHLGYHQTGGYAIGSGLLFIGILQVWRDLLSRLDDSLSDNSYGHHPHIDARLERLFSKEGEFATELRGLPAPEMIPVGMAATSLPSQISEELFPKGMVAASDINMRYLPQSLVHQGRPNLTPRTEAWRDSISELLLAGDEDLRRIGLWVLSEAGDGAFVQLFTDIAAGGEETEPAFEVLEKIDPFYKQRQKVEKRLRQARLDGQLQDLLPGIVFHANLLASDALKASTSARSPTTPGFFEN